MQIDKKFVNNVDYEIIFRDEKDDEFKIYFYDSYLCFSMINYYDDNEFIINSGDCYLFNYFNCLFEKIKKYDSNLVLGNVFRWKSENFIISGDVSELLIICEVDKFILKFVRGKRDFLSKFHESCDIYFDLNCSKYPEIVHLFNVIYISYEMMDIKKKKVRRIL